jgi:hypothetical protein
MYSSKINKRNLEAANKIFQRQYPHEELTYHSPALVDEMNAHFETIRGKDGQFTRPLTPEEDLWITNERIVCRINHRYTLVRYMHIKDRFSKIVKFNPNIAQKIIVDVLAEMEEAGVELVLQFLKARRLGVSTLFQLLVAIRIMFSRNISVISSAANPETSDKLSKMLWLAIEKTPFWLRPLCPYLGDSAFLNGKPNGRYKTGIFYEFSNGVRLDIEHGDQKADPGRGENPSVAHFSETAKIEKPENLIDAGFMRAMIPSPMNLACFEGTGEGNVGWWPKKWEFNKKNYGIPGSGARMRPTFLGWYVGRDIYPSETDLRTQGWYEIGDTWEPSQGTAEHAKQCAKAVRADPLLTKHLGKDWVMPREQMFFYETNIKEYRVDKKLHIWAREMAANDRAAFTPSYKSVFDPDLLMKYQDAIAEPKGVFGLRGTCGKDQLVPKRYQPTEHLGGTSLRVTADWSRKIGPFNFELYPLKFKGWNEFDEAGKIIIWEWPKKGEIYSLATDNADGLGADRTVIQILRKGGMGRCDAQVVEFCSDAISGVELWPWVLALGTFYSTMRDGKMRLPKLIPETNREGGRQLLKELEMRGWKSNDIYFEYKHRSTSRKAAGTVSYGWQMTPMNRDELVQRGIQALENEVIEVNSPALVDEMASFVRDENGKKTAAKNRHDDRLICLFLAFHGLYAEIARATGADPTIERTRAIPEEVLYPVATEGSMNDVSRYLDEMIGG